MLVLYSSISRQFITHGDNTIVEAQVHLVFVNEKGKPVKVPEKIFDNFKPYFCDSIKFQCLTAITKALSKLLSLRPSNLRRDSACFLVRYPPA